jgi:GDP-L-fucose synthase
MPVANDSVTDFEPAALDRSAPTFIAGHRGMVGSAIHRRLEGDGFSNLHVRTRSELDLTDRRATFEFFEMLRPDVVVLAAARVGGQSRHLRNLDSRPQRRHRPPVCD